MEKSWARTEDSAIQSLEVDHRLAVRPTAGSARVARSETQPQIRRAVSATSLSLAHCCSSVMRLPSAVEAKPHCGLSARFSSGTNRAASSMRRARLSADSKLRQFRADQAEDDGFSLRHEAQWHERARAIVVVFEQEPIDFERSEQFLGDRVVAAFGVPMAAVVAAAKMDRERDAVAARGAESMRCRPSRHRRAQHRDPASSRCESIRATSDPCNSCSAAHRSGCSSRHRRRAARDRTS